ncbi:MAG: helix-turn-helix transcriptional regulator [Ruminococcaceae bacterium]|nr:helix-turn-helix transcriptional regulator [Oscillospiraceae bacterium]
MDNFKKIVAENIIRLRTASGLTQAQLGEKLNYSDKSISKWERADALPDAFVLKQMAEVFGVSVDYILAEHAPDEKVKVQKVRTYSRSVISSIALIGIWTLAVLAFVISWLYGTPIWLIFVYTVPVSLVVLLVLNSIWGIGKLNMYIISGIVWGVITCIYLTFMRANWWQLFIIGVPAQIIIILSFYIKKNRKK